MRANGKRLPVLVVGSVNMDLVMQIDRAPRGGETLLGRSYHYVPGGKGANQAVAAARLGLEVSLVGRVGSDAHGEVLRSNLVREGIDTTHLVSDPEAQSGFAAILVESEGENRIVVFPGANMAITEPQVAAAVAGDLRAVIVNLEIPAAMVEAACRLAGQRGIPVILDAGPVREMDFSRLRGLEIISPNETETLAITGIACTDVEQTVRAARRLLEIARSRYAVIKLGQRGALIYDGEAGNSEHVPGFAVQALDTTAAGDAFTAAMAAHYLRHGRLSQAVRYANAAGALAVTRLGAQPSLPSRAELRRFLDV